MDPNSPEGIARKLYHDLSAQARIKAQAGKMWKSFSEWMSDEHAKYVEGKPWQKVFEPRRISPPGGYQSPKNVAATISSFFQNVAMERAHGLALLNTEVTACSVLYEVVRHKVPIYYVADGFIRAVAATELPKDFTLHDLHWPMPGLVLGFPSKFMQEYSGRDLCYVFAADLPEGDHNPPRELDSIPWARDLMPVTTPDKVGLMFSAFENGELGSWVSAYHKKDRVDEAISKYAYTDYTFADQARVADDERVTKLITALLFKLLVVLNTRPSLAETGGIERPEKRHHKTGLIEKTELWSPNIIGARYRVLRQPGTGTHASPGWHWRRGHVTHQRIGSLKSPDFVSIASLPRREDNEIDWLQVPTETREAFWRSHKRLWLEPTLINFEE